VVVVVVVVVVVAVVVVPVVVVVVVVAVVVVVVAVTVVVVVAVVDVAVVVDVHVLHFIGQSVPAKPASSGLVQSLSWKIEHSVWSVQCGALVLVVVEVELVVGFGGRVTVVVVVPVVVVVLVHLPHRSGQSWMVCFTSSARLAAKPVRRSGFSLQNLARVTASVTQYSGST